MKIVFLASTERWGGAERWLVTVARGASARGHSAAVAATPGSPLERDAGAAGLPTIPFGFGRKLSRRTAAGAALRWRSDGRRADRFAREMRSKGWDVLCVQFKRDQLLATAAARRAGLAAVWCEHGPLPRPFGRAPLRLAYAHAARAAERILAVSRATAAAIEAAGVPAGKIRVVRSGVNPHAFDAVPADRAALGLDAADLVVGCFGRLTEAKGIETLLEAWSALEIPRGRLLVAGDGPLADRVASAPRARYLGRRDDMPALMAACDIVVVPSREPEGIPLALLEAMAAGRAIVATDAGGTAEALEDTGALVRPGDAGALAAAIAALAADAGRRASLGAAARARARVAFTEDRMIEETLSVFAEALDERRARS